MHFQTPFLVKPLAVAMGLALTSLSSAGHAVSLSEIQKFSAVSNEQSLGGMRFTTASGQALQIDVVSASVFRVQASRDQKFRDADNKAATIVLPQSNKGSAQSTWQHEDKNEYHLIRTSQFALRVYKKPTRLALYKADNQTLLWRELQSLDIGDKQTRQTLSSDPQEQFYGGGQQNGHITFKGKTLEVSYSGGWEEGDRPSPAPFYMSTKGYGVLRNTWSNGSYDFRSNDVLTSLHKEDRFDAYYMVGSSIRDVLAHYTQLTGRVQKLARWAYEYGDADCYNDGDNVKKPGTTPAGWSDGPTGRTPDVIESVAAKYREHDMPGGWILPNDGYGCGYTDLPKVVQGLKKYGFRTGLWTENGVDKIAWEVGTAGTRAQKLDVAWTGKGYQFSLDANMAAAQGILNNSDSRPFVWTVMGWAGTQRYAVTWTGDQSGSWDYIRWHIPTLIGSGLSGQAYATGDVDGIFGGSPETYTRDLQWKAFTPVLMGMSGWSKAVRKHPWWFDEPYRSINRQYLKLKMRLMPYMYTLAHETELTGAPLVRGLQWDHPQDPNAHNDLYKYQFFLGKDFLVAPVYRSQAASRGWRKGIYLPQGRWIDYWDGRVVDAGAAGRVIDQQVTLERLPIMVRAGAIIPMYPSALYDGQVPKNTLTLDIYPFGESQYTLYEDDGETRQYQQNKFTQQEFSVKAGSDTVSAPIHIRVGERKGQYEGMETERQLVLQVHTRFQPASVAWKKNNLPMLNSKTDFDAAQAGWWYDANDKYGTVFIKIAKHDVRLAHEFDILPASASALTKTADYPAAPELGDAIPSDGLMVVNRPAEEPGHPLENAFDGKPETWFRTIRDQAQKTGPHEFTLALGDRRLVKGFEIAPRNDKYWEYGQVKDFEVYVGDSNGDWGTPVYRGRLAKKQEKQRVEFPARAGRLFRFRVLSTHDQKDDGSASDPMVLVADEAKSTQAKAVNALVPSVVTPVTISEFAILEQATPKASSLQLNLNELKGVPTRIKLNQAASKSPQAMKMNDLEFSKGFGFTHEQSLNLSLQGNWHTFRADVGIDDQCKAQGGMQFQVWGDDKLLYSSGHIVAPAVVKPELDIRGIKQLTLKTTGGKVGGCGNWANPVLLGYEGDRVLVK